MKYSETEWNEWMKMVEKILFFLRFLCILTYTFEVRGSVSIRTRNERKKDESKRARKENVATASKSE